MSQHGGQDAASKGEERDLREIPAIPEHQSGATLPTSYVALPFAVAT